jgi:hypothetical protein
MKIENEQKRQFEELENQKAIEDVKRMEQEEKY